MPDIPSAQSVLDAAAIPVGTDSEVQQRTAVLVQRQASLWHPGTSGSWVVLPADLEDSPFLLVARDSEGARRGRETIKAFVGPDLGSMSDLPTRRTSQTLQRLQALGLEEIYELRVVSNRVVDAARALDLLVSVRASAPDLTRQAPPALAFLLRDFRLAVEQRDAAGSAELLAQMESLGQLSAENLRFLRIERFASLGRWQEIVDLPGFDDLARTRRPRRISEQLLEAVWRSYIEGEDGVATVAAAVARFERGEVRQRFGALLRSIDTPTRPRARRLVALSAVDEDPVRFQRLRETADAEEVAFLDDLQRATAETGTETGASAPGFAALAAVADWPGVLAAAEADSGNPAAVEAAVRAAFELDDERLARRAVALVAGIGQDNLPTTPGFRRVIQAVENLALDACPSWLDWFTRVAGRDAWPDAAEIARNNASNWAVASLEADSSGERAAALVLEAQDGPNASQVVSTLDLLCRLAAELVALSPASAFVPAVMLLVSEQENPSRQIREAIRALLEAVLDSGPLASTYEQYLLVLGALWNRIASPASLDWALDTIDVVINYPCPAPPVREAYVRDVLAWAHQHRQQVSRSQALVLVALSAHIGVEAGLDDLVAVDDTDPMIASVWSRLANCRVGLYSLLPNIGQRLQARLSEFEATATVEQNADMVSTAALRSLASGSDFMIVDTWHATHSATQAIDDVLPRADQVLPRGGGVMSMISALLARLESLE